MNHLTPDQYQIIRDTVRNYGTFGLAASNAGISLTYLRRVLAGDEDFAQELNDMMEIHADGLYVTALQRAQTSDSILVKLLEAKRPEFSTEGRKQALQQTGRPNRLILRTFDDSGNEAGVEDVAPKQQSAQPLQIELDPNRL